MFMSIDEIHKMYDGQWIYAIDCETSDVGTVLGGRVVFHSPDSKEVISFMKEYDKTVKTLTYFRYAGKVPEDMSYLL